MNPTLVPSSTKQGSLHAYRPLSTVRFEVNDKLSQSEGQYIVFDVDKYFIETSQNFYYLLGKDANSNTED